MRVESLNNQLTRKGMRGCVACLVICSLRFWSDDDERFRAWRKVTINGRGLALASGTSVKLGLDTSSECPQIESFQSAKRNAEFFQYAISMLKCIERVVQESPLGFYGIRELAER